MDLLWVSVISLLSGIAAAMGLGGGTFLIIYLTVFAGAAQTAAQGINLVFFIPAAAAALWLHSRNGLVEWRSVIPALLGGVVTAVIFAQFANSIEPWMIKKLFGVFIVLAGMRIFINSRRKESGICRSK